MPELLELILSECVDKMSEKATAVNHLLRTDRSWNKRWSRGVVGHLGNVPSVIV